MTLQLLSIRCGNMSEWKPINTAPKDVWIIGYDPSLLGVCFAICESVEWGWYVEAASQDGLGYYDMPLTHWMPIPEPPKE